MERSTASWPNTNGKTLVGSDYSKLETRKFSEVNEFPKEYSATPVLDSQKNLALFIKGNQVDINSLPTDGTGGKPKLIKTSEMGSNTYFYANNIMSVLQNGKYVDVDLKLVVTGTDLGSDSTSVGFGVKGKNESGNQFLSTGSGSQVAQRGNFTKFHYQFFVHGTNTPIAVKFHMGFTDLDFEEAIKIQENVVNKVYVDQKSKLPYTIENGMLAITRDFNDNTNKNDTNASGNTHVVLYDIDAPINGFDLDISTSGHDSKNSSAISQGSKVSPSVLSTMKYEGTLETNYLDKNGNKLTDTEYNSDIVGTNYTTFSKEIPGYKLIEQPNNANGTYIDGRITVNYVYVKQGDLVVNYVDKDGNKLATSNNETGDVDSSYTTKPKEIPGYKLVETPSNANGTYTDGTTTVNYVYEKEQVSGKTTYVQNKADKTNREKNLSSENPELPKTSVSENVSKQYFIVGLLVAMFGFVIIKLRNKKR